MTDPGSGATAETSTVGVWREEVELGSAGRQSTGSDGIGAAAVSRAHADTGHYSHVAHPWFNAAALAMGCGAISFINQRQRKMLPRVPAWLGAGGQRVSYHCC